MKEILPGFWSWSVFNQERGMNFNGHLVVSDQGCVLIDPPSMGPQELEHAASLGPPAAIVITNRHHTRDAMTPAGHFKIRILVHELDAEALPATVRLGGIFKDGDQLPAGLLAVGLQDQKSPGECALLHARSGVLILGDALIGKPAGQLNLLPAEKYGDVAKARAGIKRLTDFRFDSVLVGDGEPVLTGGRAAVEAFLARA